MAEECEVRDTDGFNAMLDFYHDLGSIIYFSNKSIEKVNDQDALKSSEDIVILNPQWLIDVFKAVVTIAPEKERVRLCGLCNLILLQREF